MFLSFLSSLLNPKTLNLPLNTAKIPKFPFSSSPNLNETLTNYLIKTFNFPRSQALQITNRFKIPKSSDNPQSVHQYLRHLGFSEQQIRVSVLKAPQILFTHVERTLKPKFDFFAQSGLAGSELGDFVSKNPKILTVSLEKRLVPCIKVVQRVLSSVESDRNDVLLVLRRCHWILYKKPECGLLGNIAYLESCGIVGSQLGFLMKRQPSVFVMRESGLRRLVSEALQMGFGLKSRMLVYAVYVVSCVSKDTVCRKVDLFKSYGFSEEECMEMFKKAPSLIATSEEKLSLGIEFYMNIVRFDKSVLVYRPACLMNSIEERVVPRYRVLQVLTSKRLLEKEPSFLNVLNLTEEKFLEKYISRFRDSAEELLVAYKGHLFYNSESHDQ